MDQKDHASSTMKENSNLDSEHLTRSIPHGVDTHIQKAFPVELILRAKNKATTEEAKTILDEGYQNAERQAEHMQILRL